MIQERRQYERYDFSGTVEYFGTEGVRCQTIEDISQGGMRLALTGRQQPGTRVKLRIQMPEMESPVDTIGQVVWARQTHPYEVGIRFLEQDQTLLSFLPLPQDSDDPN